jgi:uncharacterized Zn finger protein (UPF0148 family)
MSYANYLALMSMVLGALVGILLLKEILPRPTISSGDKVLRKKRPRLFPKFEEGKKFYRCPYNHVFSEDEAVFFKDALKGGEYVFCPHCWREHGRETMIRLDKESPEKPLILEAEEETEEKGTDKDQVNEALEKLTAMVEEAVTKLTKLESRLEKVESRLTKLETKKTKKKRKKEEEGLNVGDFVNSLLGEEEE